MYATPVGVEVAPHDREPLDARLAERLADRGRLLERGAHGVRLRLEVVEDRAAGSSAAFSRVASSRRDAFSASHAREPLEIGRPALATADGVQLELVPRDSQPPEERVVELDQLGVDRGVVAPDRLDGRLPVLAISSLAGRRRSGTSTRS